MASNEAKNLILYMIRELSSMKYFYKEIIEGAYDTAIEHKNFKVPSESKGFICDMVLRGLKTLL
jgi:hypothetical protein